MSTSTSRDDERSSDYAAAWQQLDTAHQLRHSIARSWNGLDLDSTVSAWVRMQDVHTGAVGLAIRRTAELEDLQTVGRAFIAAVKGSLDSAIQVTEEVVSGVFGAMPLNTFPLCSTPSAFKDVYDTGALSGLRPDQLRLLEFCQPYAITEHTPRRAATVRSATQLLESIGQLDASADVLGVWAHSAEPSVIVDPPNRVRDVDALPATLVRSSTPIGEFRVEPGNVEVTGLQANPGVALDLAFAVPPWPYDADADTVDRRCIALLAVSSEIIRGLERSVGLRNDLGQTLTQESGTLSAATQTHGEWGPVDTSQYPNLESDLEQSDLGLGVYSDDAGQMVMLIRTEAGVYGRTVPKARVLEPSLAPGTAAESATLSAAAEWGLADFVIPPKKVAKGAASRELGDGTVIFGNRGLAIQVKARILPPDVSADRERNWIVKNAAKGARQASGTIRTLTDTPQSLDNARGRSLFLDAAAFEWVTVVIIDHEEPPDEIPVIDRPSVHRVVVLLRREWEFLFDQLRSITAVGAYIHRISDDVVAPGDQIGHYFELANADLEATDVAQNGQRLPGQGTRFSYPLLPRQPASTADTAGAAMYRQLLEDLATSPWEHSERDRLDVLHMVDQHPVLERAIIGRRLLDQLSEMRSVLGGQTRLEHRRYLLAQNNLQLAFSVCNHLSERHRGAFRCWTMLRHHEWISGSTAGGRHDLRTVSILLTPRHDGLRPWDTTVLVIFGDLEVEDEELATWREVFGSSI